jgi:hypothetical protein
MKISDAVKKMSNDFYGPHDFVQTSPCGAGEHHLGGLVGVLWRIKSPESVRVGDCFMDGRLKKNDLWLGIAHSGDCFQTYMYVKEYANCLIGEPNKTFGSYGIGDSVAVTLSADELEILKRGGRIERDKERKPAGS